jgi:hypothetical protein
MSFFVSNRVGIAIWTCDIDVGVGVEPQSGGWHGGIAIHVSIGHDRAKVRLPKVTPGG